MVSKWGREGGEVEKEGERTGFSAGMNKWLLMPVFKCTTKTSSKNILRHSSCVLTSLAVRSAFRILAAERNKPRFKHLVKMLLGLSLLA